jgi:hypothetical protein
MPKFSTRTTLTVLIVLGVVFAIFATVQAASADRSKVGSHPVSGAMVNLNHDRLTVAELESYNAPLDTYNGDFKDGSGHGGCESENLVNPNDF